MKFRIVFFTASLFLLVSIACSKDNANSGKFTITQIDSRKAYTGDIVTVFGTGLDVQGLTFKIDEVELPVVEVSNSEAKLFVPEGANTGIIKVTLGDKTEQFGDFVVFEEEDNFFGHLQENNCGTSSIMELTTDNFEPEMAISNLPETCISIDKILYCQERNIIVYSYTYLLPTGGEARKANIKNLTTQENHELILSEGPDDLETSSLLSVSRDILFFVEYRSQNPKGLQNQIIHEYYFEFNEFFLTTAQFRADSGVSISSAYNDAERLLLVYYRDEGATEGRYLRISENNGGNVGYSTNENVKDIYINREGQAFALSLENNNWLVNRISPLSGVVQENLSSFSADHADNLFYSESTNRLFVKYSKGGSQKLHKIPLGEGSPSDFEIETDIKSIYTAY